MTKQERLTALHEGYSKTPYKCPAGYWTVGWGTNLEARGWTEEEIRALEARGGVEEAQALSWLQEDLGRATEAARRAVGRAWEGLGEPRRAVLVDMAYNLGEGRFREFRRFLSAARVGNWALAGREMEDSRWFHQVGRRAWRLQMMMLKGRWTEELEPQPKPL